MVDILERLQSLQTSLGTLWPQPNLHEEAAEKIIQLRKELDETKRAADAFVENEHLREENARLREALKPFADGVDCYTETASDEYPVDYGHFFLGNLRAAADAIREGGKKCR